MAPADGTELLRTCRSVLLVDWPSREVPHALARLGMDVVAAEGPETYRVYELTEGGGVRSGKSGSPASTDLVYAYRPLAELVEIADLARRLGARAVWVDHLDADETAQARAMVEAVGLAFVSEPSLHDAAAAARSQAADA